MKKFISLICLIIVCFTMNAQDVIGVYYNSYAQKKHQVGYSAEYGFLIEVSNKSSYETSFYIIKSSYAQVFQTQIKEAKKKFIEWKQVCEENNMHNVDKYMNITFPQGMYLWGSHLALYATPKARFMAYEDGTYRCALFFVDRMTDINNKYITTNAVWVLSNEEEFDKLAEFVSLEKLKEIRDNKAKQNELFK